jgi:hypothetical protein
MIAVLSYSRRREIVLVLIGLFAGIVVTVGVAYSCFFFAETSVSYTGRTEPPPTWMKPYVGGLNRVDLMDLAYGFGVERRLYESYDRCVGAEYLEVGWPFRAIGGGVSLEPPTEFVFITSIDSERLRSISSIPGTARLVPVGIEWAGFLLDTSVYGTAVWLMITSPGRLRRLVRWRKRCCPECGYPIGQSTNCTECGKPVRDR